MSTEPELPAAIRSFADAINSGDTDGVVAQFSPQGLVDDWGTTYLGHDRVRQWTESDATGAGATMTVLTAATDGDTTTIRFGWRSSVFNGESTGIFVVTDGVIQSFTIPPGH